MGLLIDQNYEVIGQNNEKSWSCPGEIPIFQGWSLAIFQKE